jgi:hypothetical protein
VFLYCAANQQPDVSPATFSGAQTPNAPAPLSVTGSDHTIYFEAADYSRPATTS